jgi:hypothetical protein
MVSPSTRVVAVSTELTPAYVGLEPDISFIEERSVWATTPDPAAPPKVQAIEIATPPGWEVAPPLRSKSNCPIEMGSQVTDRSWDVSMVAAPPSVVGTGDVMTASPGMVAVMSNAGARSGPRSR